MRYLVLGMHRSGTSAVTGLLERLGCFVADDGDRMPPRDDNPRGFGERLDVARLNDELLWAAGATWHMPSDFDLRSIPAEQLDVFWERGRSIVRVLESHRPWVLKDPRMALLMSFWDAILPARTEIVVHRHPVQVSQSLAARDEIPLPLGLALWERYQLAILRHVATGVPIIVGFEKLVEDPVRVSREIFVAAQRLPRRHGLLSPDPERVRAHIDPELVHYHLDGGADDRALNREQLELRAVLLSGTVFPGLCIPPLSRQASAILDVHRHGEMTARAAREQALAASAEEIRSLRSTLQRKEARLTRLRSLLAREKPPDRGPQESDPGR
jgi:hypothetical protein